MKMKKLLVIISIVAVLAGCNDDAQIAKRNMAKAADNFEIMRRVVFYNSITDKIVMVTEGKCSVEPSSLRTSVICKTGDNKYITNYYGRSDNTVYFVEQMEAVPVSVYHYRRTFKPQSILPDIDFRGSSRSLIEAVTPDRND